MHPEAKPIWIAYSNAETPDRLGIKGYQRVLTPLEPGWYAIGVNELYGSSEQYKIFHSLKPVDYIGYSIYVYFLKDSDVRTLVRDDT